MILSPRFCSTPTLKTRENVSIKIWRVNLKRLRGKTSVSLKYTCIIWLIDKPGKKFPSFTKKFRRLLYLCTPVTLKFQFVFTFVAFYFKLSKELILFVNKSMRLIFSSQFSIFNNIIIIFLLSMDELVCLSFYWYFPF